MLLNKWGINFKFSVDDGEISYTSFGTLEGSKVNLKLSLENFNLIEKFTQNPYEVVEVTGENIRTFKSNYQSIEIPIFKDFKNVILKFIPIPNLKFKADLSIDFTDFYIEDVLCQSFGKGSSDLIRFTHDLFKIDFDLINNKFNFKIEEKIRSLTQARKIYGFLSELMHKESDLTLKVVDPLNGKARENDEFSFSFGFHEEEIIKELRYLFNLIEKLISVEKFYRIKFKNFYFDLDAEEEDTLRLLLLNMSDRREKIDFLKYEAKLPEETNEFKKEILHRETNFLLAFAKGIHLSLFNETIYIKDRKLTFNAPDVVVKNKNEVVKLLKSNKKRDTVSLILESKSNKLVRYFE